MDSAEIERAKDYVEAVKGFIAGESRIVEYWRRGQAFKAKLQSSNERGWETVFTWSKLSIPLGRSTTMVIQNVDT